MDGNGSGPKVIGADKHITFGGRTAGGVNIPGGLRMAEPKEHSAPPRRNSASRVLALFDKPRPVFIGGDKHIEFTGHSSGGVNIPTA